MQETVELDYLQESAYACLELFTRDVEVVRVLKTISGWREVATGVYRFPADPYVIHNLHDGLAPLRVALKPTLRMSEWWHRTLERNRLSLDIQGRSDIELPGLEIASTLYPYQRVGTYWLSTMKRGILGDDMGAGKTVQAIAAAALTSSGPTLVVTTTLAKTAVWEPELYRWRPGCAVTVANGDKKLRSSIIRRYRERVMREQVQAPRGDYLIVNHEMLRQRYAKDWPLWEVKWSTIILDEAHKFSDKDSQQSKGVAALVRNVPRLWLLTGTPIWNNPQNIWHLLHLLDPKRYGSYWKFVDHYCDVVPTPWADEIIGIKPAMRDEFQQMIHPWLLRRTKAEVLPQMPSKTVTTLEYDLEPRQMQLYKKLRRSFVIEWEGVKLKHESSVAERTADLFRVCNSPTLLNPPISAASAKDTALWEVLESALEANKPVVVFTWHLDYAEHVSRLCDAHEIKNVVLTGATKPQDRSAFLRAFQDGEVRVLIASIALAGTAIDLTVASVAIFAEGAYVPALVQQAEDRLHRINQKTDVTIYRLSARNTIEDALWQTVTLRADDTDDLLTLRDTIQRVLQQQD